MKRVQTLLFLLTCIASVFCISMRFANPTEPTCYMSIAGCFVVALIGVLNTKGSEQWSASISECVLAGLIIWTVINGGFTPDFILSAVALMTLYVWVRRNQLNTKWLFFGIVLLGIVQAAYGIGQYLHWFPNSVAPAFRISGSFNNPSGFAAMLVVCLPFGLYLIRKPIIYLKLLGIVACIIMATGVILVQSRTGVVASAVIGMIWMFQLLSEAFRTKLRWTTKVAAGTIVIAVLLGGLYFQKKDSADGRLLIWNCSACMITDKPLTGHGTGGFQREYMLYQANYFNQHPDSKYAQLADIVKHPFNEYLLLLTEEGIIGFAMFGLLAWLVIREYRRKRAEEDKCFMLCLTGIGVFACFSYPFGYPFVRLMTVFCAARIMQSETSSWISLLKITPALKPIGLLVFGGFLVLTGKLFYNEYYWNIIAQQSLAGETRKVLPEYARLYPWMRGEGLFLYNYAAELNYIGEWKKSNQLMTECSRLYNDNDVQLILADNCQQLRHYNEAEKHLKLAYSMIPNRFIPLYRLVKLYQQQKRDMEAQNIAQEITRKPVKIPSYDIDAIKKEMQDLLMKEKSNN